MAPLGLRDALTLLVRDALRVVVAYALVLQMLAPIAMARAASGDVVGVSLPICSTLLPINSEGPGKAPTQVSHDCMLCCLSHALVILPALTALIEPLRLAVVLELDAAISVVAVAFESGTPPQRAPPAES